MKIDSKRENLKEKIPGNEIYKSTLLKQHNNACIKYGYALHIIFSKTYGKSQAVCTFYEA